MSASGSPLLATVMQGSCTPHIDQPGVSITDATAPSQQHANKDHTVTSGSQLLLQCTVGASQVGCQQVLSTAYAGVLFSICWISIQLLQVCGREVWLTCAILDIILGVVHMASEELTNLADTLSCKHTGQHYKDRASHLTMDRGVTLLPVPTEVFTLS